MLLVFMVVSVKKVKKSTLVPTGIFLNKAYFFGLLLICNASSQIITTVAGNGTAAYGGDGGSATRAALNFPVSVYMDSSQSLFIADSSNHRVRKVFPNGTISTVAGNGTSGYAGDRGPATNATLRSPNGVFVDNTGALFIADWNNHCIRRVLLNGTISTVAGNGTSGFAGDGGPATSAMMMQPTAVFCRQCGEYFYC
jgi:hypothetical protein